VDMHVRAFQESAILRCAFCPAKCIRHRAKRRSMLTARTRCAWARKQASFTNTRTGNESRLRRPNQSPDPAHSWLKKGRKWRASVCTVERKLADIAGKRVFLAACRKAKLPPVGRIDVGGRCIDCSYEPVHPLFMRFQGCFA